ncbi:MULTISPECIES: SIR2 family NAD-dependent protein deacylase [Prauserella salsuginis group]|uniref:protein acetyllysine N-acetyltransferase n=1 Tax=Prauserella salsuginis TaxID=387889 RepID=A0ABW6G6Y8_9PSEU|nr:MULTISPECIES: Sir2 family NAD-dependent protein deacetylase [Prauserella salsuginis group]MCR3720841.1 NAD-dependent protein deacetylase, SIR2 family [Prauserella flava]MCR3735078.1 NAD-dependent protein deacetylase, SIR2 family [Prauserella salsuginis]
MSDALDHEDELERAAELIGYADALLICAGAGMGVDSGLPDFRGDEGFWRAYPPYARLGLSFVEVADPVHFAADPELAWGFYGHRLELYRRTTPHPGFDILRRWAAGKPDGARVFTSNVDGQFQKAGFAGVAEVHGSIHHLQCLTGCSAGIWPADDMTVTVDEATMRAEEPLPSCPGCGALARPNILMFGDADWLGERSQQQLDELQAWRRRTDKLAVVELGAGLAVPTVRRQAELASAADGGLIRINPREPEVRHDRGISLSVGALDALRAIDARLNS